jgi:hypothetical protein
MQLRSTARVPTVLVSTDQILQQGALGMAAQKLFANAFFAVRNTRHHCILRGQFVLARHGVLGSAHSHVHRWAFAKGCADLTQRDSQLLLFAAH